jgi:glycosyltransferase involved in cell wall biosynthesis
VSAARNLGIEMAQAELLAFLDSDDVWMPHKLERQLARLRTTQDKICHTEEIWIRHGRRVNPKKRHHKPEGWVFEACLPLCAISPSSAMVHRSVFDDMGGFDESYAVCEDYELWLRLSTRYRVSLVTEPLIMKFGGHEDQLSRRYWGMDRWRVRALYSRILDLTLRREWREAAFDEMQRKLKVLIQGYSKRGREATVRELADFGEAVARWLRGREGPNRALEPAPPLPGSLDTLSDSDAGK